jgi:hypothetical protein
MPCLAELYEQRAKAWTPTLKRQLQEVTWFSPSSSQDGLRYLVAWSDGQQGWLGTFHTIDFHGLPIGWWLVCVDLLTGSIEAHGTASDSRITTPAFTSLLRVLDPVG